MFTVSLQMHPQGSVLDMHIIEELVGVVRYDRNCTYENKAPKLLRSECKLIVVPRANRKLKSLFPNNTCTEVVIVYSH